MKEGDKLKMPVPLFSYLIKTSESPILSRQ